MKKKLLLFFSFSIISSSTVAMDDPTHYEGLLANSDRESPLMTQPTYFSMIRQATNLSTKNDKSVERAAMIGCPTGIVSAPAGAISLGISIGAKSAAGIAASSCCLVGSVLCLGGSLFCINELAKRNHEALQKEKEEKKAKKRAAFDEELNRRIAEVFARQKEEIKQ